MTVSIAPVVLIVISLSGGLGALLRCAIGLWWSAQHQVPWSTFTINVMGCFAIGILMVLITGVWVAHRLLRPFLGIGFLGGFTTFSIYSVEVRRLLESGAAVRRSVISGGRWWRHWGRSCSA
ncbi:fluoride efflux transporter FluC [Nocardia sp. CA-129566]|uniref:fluoride efflux transporter FluC n=1 Tax=Nocardia sp. CA-129566 TaxID=3239976 RepID=UPI003D976415